MVLLLLEARNHHQMRRRALGVRTQLRRDIRHSIVNCRDPTGRCYVLPDGQLAIIVTDRDDAVSEGRRESLDPPIDGRSASRHAIREGPPMRCIENGHAQGPSRDSAKRASLRGVGRDNVQMQPLDGCSHLDEAAQVGERLNVANEVAK